MQLFRTNDVIMLDDLELVSGARKLSGRGWEQGGGVEGWRGVGGHEVALLKSLCDYAVANGKKLVFRALGEAVGHFVGHPLRVEMKSLKAADYAFFLSKFMGLEAASKIDANRLHARYASLTPAELRVSCVPVFASTSKAAVVDTMEEEAEEGAPDRKTPDATDAFLENVCARLGESHGAINPQEVEAVDLTTMPGLDKVLRKLEQHVILPLEHIASNGKSGAALPKAGVLLYGPPGTGKTSVGRYLAHRMKGKFFFMKEMHVWKEMMDVFRRAEQNAPSIVFIDDVDVMLARQKVAWGGAGELFRYLLGKLDGMSTNKREGDASKYTCVIMACADVKLLPEALIRSGRIELWIKTERPGNKTRREMLKKILAEEGGALNDSPISETTVQELADRSEDWNAADLRRLVRDARNLLFYKQQKGEEFQTEKVLIEAHKDLRKMVEEVEYFQRQMYT